MLEVVEKIKRNFLPLTLIVLYLAFIVITWGKWGHVMSDSFREAIIPQAMLDGKILYKDILNLYPPLAYQLNAILFKIFGCHLSVLYLAGIICGAINLSLLYILIKRYSSDVVAFVSTITVMELLTFRICINNSASWFFPYSYSFLYSFTCCFAAIVFYLLYKNFDNNEQKSDKFLYIISLFIGFSIAFKLDFFLFIFLPLFETIKNKSFKQFFICLGLILIPNLLTYGAYLLAGGSIGDLINEYNFLIEFSKARSVVEFNKYVMPQAIYPDVIKDLILSSKFFLEQIPIIILYSYAVFWLFEKNQKNRILNVFIGIFALLICWIFLIHPFSVAQFNKLGIDENIVFIPYVLMIWAICILCHKRFRFQNLLNSEKFCIALVFIGFLITFRQYAEVKIAYIGNFTIIPYWCAFVYFCMVVLPDYFSKFKNSIFNKTVACSFIIFGTLISSVYFCYYVPNMKYKINSEKDTFYTGLAHAPALNDTLAYINDNIPKDKTIVVMDECLLLNWFSDRKTNMKYYALIPHMIDTIGEQKIIGDLASDMPDYIFITNNNYPLVGYFGIHYAQGIIQFVFDNYYCVKSIIHPELKKSLEITVFKKKEQAQIGVAK